MKKSISEFRESVYQKVTYRPAAILDLVDALTIAGYVNSPVALSESPIFRRKFSSVYDALVHGELGNDLKNLFSHILSGNDYRSGHPGIDIAAGEGSPVYAADSGVVIAKGNDDSGYGNVILIDYGNDYSTVYAHLSVIEVNMCQSVDAGQQTGLASNTGNSRGVRLHFEVVQDGLYINPWLFLP